MIGALLFLLTQSWKNRTLMRIRRLKKPKYLVCAIVGAGYFYFYFFRFLLFPRGYGMGNNMGVAAGVSPDHRYLLESLGALILFTLVLIGWVFPQQRAALVFSEAEVAFLFPAPVSRRTLIHYKLLKSQVAIFFGTLILTAATGRLGHGGAGLFRVLSWWLMLSTLNLHLLGASFMRTNLLDHGISNWTRRLVVLGIVGGVVVWVSVWAWRTMPPPPLVEPGQEVNVQEMSYYAKQLTQFGPVPYLLYPFRLAVRPYFTTNAADFLRAAWPVMVLLMLNYLWVVRSNVAFEEASVEASRKMAEKVAAMRSGRRHALVGGGKRKRPPFRLPPIGWPPMALLWKNLISAGQGFTLRFWLLIVWIVVIAGMLMSHAVRNGEGLGMVVGPMALGLLAMSFLLGPQMARQDFRQDLPVADILKTYPLPAWQLALGELLAPAAILTAIQWCLILLAALVFPHMEHPPLLAIDRIAYGFALAVLAPVLNVVSLIIPNAAVLLFPGWFQPGKDATSGIEATGQRMVFMIGQLLVLLVSLIPAAILVVVAIFAGRAFSFPLALTLPLAAIGAALIMAVEAGFGLVLLGKLFEKFDVASDGVVS